MLVFGFFFVWSISTCVCVLEPDSYQSTSSAYPLSMTPSRIRYAWLPLPPLPSLRVARLVHTQIGSFPPLIVGSSRYKRSALMQMKMVHLAALIILFRLRQATHVRTTEWNGGKNTFCADLDYEPTSMVSPWNAHSSSYSGGFVY